MPTSVFSVIKAHSGFPGLGQEVLYLPPKPSKRRVFLPFMVVCPPVFTRFFEKERFLVEAHVFLFLITGFPRFLAPTHTASCHTRTRGVENSPRIVPVDAAACRVYRDPGGRNRS